MDLTKLFDVPTTDEIVQSFWQAYGVPASKIRPLGAINQTVYAFAIGASSLWRACQNITMGLGDIRTSRGLWLDTLALGFYDLVRRNAAPTTGHLDVSAASPVTSIVVQNIQTGVQYQWTDSAPIGPAPFFLVTFTAQQSGEIGNCPVDELVSITPGVSITTPPTAGKNWILTLGMDTETDDQLQQRCLDIVRARGGAVSDAIAAKLRQLTNGQIQRVFVKYNTVSSSVLVYAASANGLMSSATQALASAGINLYTSPFTNSASVAHPNVAIIKLIGSLSFQPGTTQSTITDIRNKLSAWVNSLPIVTNGNDGSMLILSDITRKLNQLDNANVMRFASFIASCNGARATGMTDPIPASSGSIYQLDLTDLKTVFQ